MVLSLRRVEIDDHLSMQNVNTMCLPENYSMKYYWYHALSWPQNLHCVTTPCNQLAGYVLGKMEDNDDKQSTSRKSGHITSLAVMRDFRRLGSAVKMMDLTHNTMENIYGGDTCTLHVRESNRAAYGLYQSRLNYSVLSIDYKYYADQENACEMQKVLKPSCTPLGGNKKSDSVRRRRK
eukprot:GHVH01012245.1.p1 GENE.GHVH01012245.1~~GHVH01012245.1.p1  ORF type:complete len:179 (+),score=13.41 GHVH01012245.1:24-560(+)